MNTPLGFGLLTESLEPILQWDENKKHFLRKEIQGSLKVWFWLRKEKDKGVKFETILYPLESSNWNHRSEPT